MEEEQRLTLDDFEDKDINNELQKGKLCNLTKKNLIIIIIMMIRKIIQQMYLK